MQITIQGAQGSGKSTVAKLLAEKLKYKHYSAGDFMRQIAAKRGMSLLELSKIAEKDGGAIDKELDDLVRSVGKKEKDFVLDGRLGFFFIPKSFKIYLTVNLDEAARRIFGNKRPGETENTTLAKTKANILRRIKSEHTRYKSYYGVEYPPKLDGFELVVDTTKLSPIDTVGVILKALKSDSSQKKSL